MECEGFHGEAQESSFNSNQSFESTESNLISEILMRSYEEVINMEESDNSQESNNILVESDNANEFPNETYADLMTLVTDYKLSNKTGNAIIKFFNKHSNVPQSHYQ